MKLAKSIYMTATLLLVGAAGLGCYTENPTMGPASKLAPPKPARYETKLAPAFAAQSMGWVVCESKDGFNYTFDAELTIYARDFKEFGIDPTNGFDDEAVVIAVTKKELGFKMVFSHQEMNAVVFTTHQYDMEGQMPVARGDQVVVTVNGADIATGKF